MRGLRPYMRGLLALTLCLGLASVAQAAVVDLTTAGSEGSINGGLFVQTDPQPTGTGFIDSFVRVDDNDGDSRGYNTTVNNVLDTGSTDQFNHELLISSLAVVNRDGVDYYQFLLDINETGNDPLLTLDELQVFTSDVPNQSVETFDGSGVVELNGDLVYRMDAGEDNRVLLNYSLNSGSGSGDMFFFLPVSALDGSTGQYLYLYSEFGLNEDEEAGFEEWAAITEEGEVIPEPATLSLIGMGLAGLALRRYRRA